MRTIVDCGLFFLIPHWLAGCATSRWARDFKSAISEVAASAVLIRICPHCSEARDEELRMIDTYNLHKENQWLLLSPTKEVQICSHWKHSLREIYDLRVYSCGCLIAVDHDSQWLACYLGETWYFVHLKMQVFVALYSESDSFLMGTVQASTKHACHQTTIGLRKHLPRRRGFPSMCLSIEETYDFPRLRNE